MRPLRLLALTVSYPPVARGGYGEACADVMEGLASRGHRVVVLTARTPPATSTGPAEVRRALDVVLAPWRRPLHGLRAARADGRQIEAALAEGVDVVLAWHMRGLVKTSLRIAHDAGVPVVYLPHDRWVLYERPGSLLLPWARLDRLGARLPRELVGAVLSPFVELRAPRVECDGIVRYASRWLEQEHERLGWRPQDAGVIHVGVDRRLFSPTSRHAAAPVERLLFAGRIHPTKGLHVALAALAAARPSLRLTVAGHMDDPVYEREVRALAEDAGLAARVDWRGEVARERMPALLAEHDVLVYPSTAVEAGFLGPLEALAVGLPVVSSAPGAHEDVLVDGENALVVAPGSVPELARALDRLVDEPGLASRLRSGGLATAERLSLDATLDAVEELLGALTSAPRP